MCGIAGLVDYHNGINLRETLSDMAEQLRHRGPDSEGIWSNETDHIGLAHTRLAILDTSLAGSQPMESKSGRFVIVFNGEIYNHKAIRLELQAQNQVSWIGSSDTETLIAAIEQWGCAATVKKLVGMFAFALWDRDSKTLKLVRDRTGEKPLYYGRTNNVFFFGSELRVAKKIPGFKNKVSRDALALYLKYSSIPAPYSIYEDIFKVEPGCIVTFDAQGQKIDQAEYWSFQEVFQAGVHNRYRGGLEEVVSDLTSVLSVAVALQMESDVPLGAFLSGGVDSSMIVALMQSQSAQAINTFSIGFEDAAFNEAEYARDVANHIGTNHSDMYVSGRDALDVIPNLPSIYDEPFADSSQIPTYLVSKIAKERVTVSLSGDAGDELFGGYTRYQNAANAWNRVNKIPAPARNLVSWAIQAAPPKLLETSISIFGGVINKRLPMNMTYDRLLKASKILGKPNQKEFYQHGFLSHNDDSCNWVLGARHLTTPIDKNDFNSSVPFENMMAIDFVHYLPTDILTKVDRAAMAVSLETRIPFLDQRVIDFACSLPPEYKIRDGKTKWALKQALYQFVPESLIERPKMGFGVPLAEWLRGPLREWAENLLNEKKLIDEGFFDPNIVRESWHEHLLGKRNWQTQLWDVLMFQAWLDAQ
ncbi:asparagine synthase (glutamine-hydrolyzing) [Gammaproteobacteria bacterium]|nr:asparagine synthase (glutamine-hydrolyzing) [Gammaproteobacteria bacterium]